MKKFPTPIAYPTTKQEEERWGFDVWKPKGVPLAWVIDWNSASVGYGVSPERLKEVREFRVGEDLNTLCGDDIFAACSDKMDRLWNNSVRQHEKMHGESKTIEFVRAVGRRYGPDVWKFLRERWGSPVPLDKFAWYQDFIHMQYGPATKAYSWFDEEKIVCTRRECRLRPPKGMESNGKYCQVCCDAVNETYMENEPTLLFLLGPDLGADCTGPRCIHMWTYNKTLIENMPDVVKPYVRETVKKMLRDRGAQI